MKFSNLQGLIVGGAMIVAVAGAAHAQDANAGFESRYAELTAAMLGNDSAKLDPPIGVSLNSSARHYMQGFQLISST